MASGDEVVQIRRIMYPAANFAAPSQRAGGSTPGERVAGLHLFDAATIEYLDFLCRLKGYGGGGLTFTLPWSAASATSGAAAPSLTLASGAGPPSAGLIPTAASSGCSGVTSGSAEAASAATAPAPAVSPPGPSLPAPAGANAPRAGAATMPSPIVPPGSRLSAGGIGVVVENGTVGTDEVCIRA